MRIIHNLDEMTETARGWLAGGSVGFVPTMGYLHEGHLSLIRAAQQECEISIAGIFVNPLQFERSEDLARYPHDPERDLQLLSTAGVDVVFIPRAEDIYPSDFSTFVVPSAPLTGRPKGVNAQVYIRGVATVMTKLFQLVRPDLAYFGQKDAHQVAVVRRLVRDLNIDIGLRILPTVRESDGLAMSSRNHLLLPAERQAANILYRALMAGKALIDGGERHSSVIEKAMRDMVATELLASLDYTAVCHPDTLSELQEVMPRTLLTIGVRVGGTFFVDNFVWLSDRHWQI
jgi:pantoate--beta-alanine ligase